MKSGAVGIEGALEGAKGDPLVQVVRAGPARRGRRACGRPAWTGPVSKAASPRSVRMIVLVHPAMRPHASHGDVGAAPEEVGALVATLERGPVEVLDRLVDGQLAVSVLDDHLPVDDVDLLDPVEVDPAAVPELPQDQALVVEALRAQERDGEHDRVDPMGAGRPATGLHGPDALDLARRADHRDPRVRPELVLGQVQLGQGHRLVVEAPRRPRAPLGRSGRWWPRPSRALRGRRSAWRPGRR